MKCVDTRHTLILSYSLSPFPFHSNFKYMKNYLTNRNTMSKLLSWHICNDEMLSFTYVQPTWTPVAKLINVTIPPSWPTIAVWWQPIILCHQTTAVGRGIEAVRCPEEEGEGGGNTVMSVVDHLWSWTSVPSTRAKAGIMKILLSCPEISGRRFLKMLEKQTS